VVRNNSRGGSPPNIDLLTRNNSRIPNAELVLLMAVQWGTSICLKKPLAADF
jgi:hypothetical protein